MSSVPTLILPNYLKKKLKLQQSSECVLADFTYSGLCLNTTPCNLAFSSQSCSETSVLAITNDVLVSKATAFFLVLILPTFPAAADKLDYSVHLFPLRILWKHTSLMHRDVRKDVHIYVTGLWVSWAFL